ncbi:MAG: UDP-N-acetylmuramoyl-L-alanyl-D-glutamate--2,6-diaminopimelate ligase [Candidatus Ratteibacteria bacterium]|nr:UDP-N-acetylmuramoyl-L-alanyl-D-glutamate--2,6-diaminopimelate ligase [Candidatus Ratteibacteria bacterium]
MKKTWILKELLQPLTAEKVKGDLRQEIRGIAYDSRRVEDDYLFFAIPGLKNNGTNFIYEAVKRGAKAIVTQKDLPDCSGGHKGVSYIAVGDAREALSRVSSVFCGFPSRRLKVIGITGTNGKTSTAYLLESILKAAHLKVGVIGTINYRMGKQIIPAVRTTPESLDLHLLLREMVVSGITHVIMEVSSHALAQRRVSRIDFDVGIFTNLSHDHLDYHKSMENYFSSKNLLFEQLGLASQREGRRISVLNGDDPASTRILQRLEAFPQVEILSFGLGDKNSLQAKVVESKPAASRFLIKNGLENIEVNLALPGKHNLYNALAAAACSAGLGINSKFIKEGLEKAKHIPGRFEFIGKDMPFKIAVDYAHTEEALRNILEASRDFNPKRVILVFGCGGDRDKSKRPLMGRVAGELAHFSILTSDNPRSEPPEKIIADIEAGFGSKKNYQVILDRCQAIESALKMARPDEMIIIAGKGHETYQIYKDAVIPFDDREAVKRILGEMGLTEDGRGKTKNG